ncbi:hypothetical protein [Deinococcus roseus]|uniref:Serine protease n=1 Tax=Deinococcus roseus TaxID=392414 RepID=A0ABQ2D394_9DEIO|nr:hypothetical protein [Deinococcus roseus]GGJ44334.1 hypothetical protein GCM10008938_33210 [Deinococcus roseus]
MKHKLLLIPLALSGLASAATLEETLAKTRLQLSGSLEFQIAQQYPDYAGYLPGSNGTAGKLHLKASSITKQQTTANLKASSYSKQNFLSDIAGAQVLNVTYSYSDLVTTLGKIRYLNQSKNWITSMTIRADLNKVELILKTANDATAVKSWLTQNAVAADSYTVNTTKTLQLYSGKSSTPNYGTIHEWQRPFLMGTRIISDPSAEKNPENWCSAGYIAAGQVNGQPMYGFITARHCIASDTQEIFQKFMLRMRMFQPDRKDEFRNQINTGYNNDFIYKPKEGSGLDAVFVPLQSTGLELKLPITDPKGPTIREFRVVKGAYAEPGGFENLAHLYHTGQTSYTKLLYKGMDFDRVYPMIVNMQYTDYAEFTKFPYGSIPKYEIDTVMYCFNYLPSYNTTYDLINPGDSGSPVYDADTMTAVGIVNLGVKDYVNQKFSICMQDWKTIARDLSVWMIPAAY